RHFVERSQVLPRDCKAIESSEISRFPPGFHIKLRADAPSEFRPAAFGGKHPGEKEQIACLHSFHIDAKRLRWRWELNAKFFQPPFGAGRPRAFAGYHLLF